MTGVAAVAVRSLRRYEPDQVLRDSAIADLSRRGAPGTAWWCPVSPRSQQIRLGRGCFRIGLL